MRVVGPHIGYPSAASNAVAQTAILRDNPGMATIFRVFAYAHDDLFRPIRRNADTFGYDDRLSHTAATLRSAATNAYEYAPSAPCPAPRLVGSHSGFQRSASTRRRGCTTTDTASSHRKWGNGSIGIHEIVFKPSMSQIRARRRFSKRPSLPSQG